MKHILPVKNKTAYGNIRRPFLTNPRHHIAYFVQINKIPNITHYDFPKLKESSKLLTSKYYFSCQLIS